MSVASDNEQDEEDDEEAEYVEEDSPRRSKTTANGPTRGKKQSILSDHDGSAESDDSGELTKGSSKSKRMKSGTGKSSERSQGSKGAKAAKGAKSATGSRTNEAIDEDTGTLSAGKRKSTAQSIPTPEDESGSDDDTPRDGDKVRKAIPDG